MLMFYYVYVLLCYVSCVVYRTWEITFALGREGDKEYANANILE